jgi:hypothetical protein
MGHGAARPATDLLGVTAMVRVRLENVTVDFLFHLADNGKRPSFAERRFSRVW